jgi:hypothetical protein
VPDGTDQVLGTRTHAGQADERDRRVRILRFQPALKKKPLRMTPISR